MFLLFLSSFYIIGFTSSRVRLLTNSPCRTYCQGNPFYFFLDHCRFSNPFRSFLWARFCPCEQTTRFYMHFHLQKKRLCNVRLTLGALRKTRRQRQRERHKTIDAHVRYNSWYISLPSSEKQQREMTTFCVFWRTWPQPLIFRISIWNWTQS